MAAGLDLARESLEGTPLPFGISLEITVKDPDTVAELQHYAPGEERQEFVLTALRIGVLALRQARGEIDGEQIRRESERMLLGLEQQLADHAKTVNQRLEGALKEYFDPESGRLPERLNRLLARDGDLESVLKRQIGTQDSELVKTLTQHLGRESPLIKLLGPEESAGLVQALRAMVAEQLAQQQEQVLREFSLDHKEGALARLVEQLSTSQGQLTENLEQRIQAMLGQFSLDKEDSALNRLMNNFHSAQRTITAEFSLDNETSALSRLKTLLVNTQEAIDDNLTLDKETSALSRLKKEMLEILERHARVNQDFQSEVKLTLGQMSARKQEAARSTQHGRDFEEAVLLFLAHETRQCGDVAIATGSSTGLKRQCKIGDCVIELGPDSAAPGARIVIEAKEKADYDIAKARGEIEEGRDNRGATVGLFIYSRRCAPAELQASTLLRYGNDVFVHWDAEDPATDLFLRTALTLAKALCIRATQQTAAQVADFKSLDQAMLEIERGMGGLSTIETAAGKIQKSCDEILDRVRIDRKSLERQVCILREKLGDLRELVGNAPPAS